MVQVIPKRNNEFIRIAAVVKRDSWFKNLKDLKGAKACFTGYRDVGEYIPILDKIVEQSFRYFCVSINGNLITVYCYKIKNKM